MNGKCVSSWEEAIMTYFEVPLLSSNFLANSDENHEKSPTEIKIYFKGNKLKGIYDVNGM
jgi:hypothetical protein